MEEAPENTIPFLDVFLEGHAGLPPQPSAWSCREIRDIPYISYVNRREDALIVRLS